MASSESTVKRPNMKTISASYLAQPSFDAPSYRIWVHCWHFLIIATTVAFSAVSLSAADEIRLEVTPRYVVYHYPSYVHAAVHIPQHAANRWRSLSWSSETGISGTEIRQVDGDHAAVNYERLLQVEPGFYVISACVFRTREAKPDGRPSCVSRDVDVSGGPE